MTKESECQYPNCKRKALWALKGKRYCIYHTNIRQGFIEAEDLV